MARPLRIQFEGAIYHLTARGNCKGDIFFCDRDRWVFLKLLEKVINRFEWICHTYCLMTNHYHLLIETPKPNLSRGMRQLNGVYTQYINHDHNRTGHVFQGRYKSILVQKDSHLLELARYIILNPVRAGICLNPEEYFWSSFRAAVGLSQQPKLLETKWILAQFSSETEIARQRYQEFVRKGQMNKPLEDILGSGLDLTP